jgi:hypothetical protein
MCITVEKVLPVIRVSYRLSLATMKKESGKRK